jgi:choline dehydrogenase-like flavoprotein
MPYLKMYYVDSPLASMLTLQGYHATSTYSMGKASDPNAVVNEKLVIKGVKGLRVADCSIMPKVNNGHT